jgi:2-keto-4-pentenoate hydratase/2-oxohepta-3-ene-1,7-dioic acid hydratase in catechol pathway
MKLATFLAPGAANPVAGEIRDGQVVTFETGSVLAHLTDRTPATGAAHPLDEVVLLEPIPRPPAIFCIGRNYAAHIAELGSERPQKPIVFLKLPLSSAPPGGPVRRPKASQALDYESELVLVMGENNTIAGYAVANDVSARDLQRSEHQWSRAKGFDTSCPWGPWITTTDEIPDPRALAITTHVNGELRQEGNTRDLIFGPEELVEFISEACTLEPGAIILTGTPSGVGEAFDPPRYLQPGDSVRCAIEGLGVLEHTISDS